MPLSHFVTPPQNLSFYDDISSFASVLWRLSSGNGQSLRSCPARKRREICRKPRVYNNIILFPQLIPPYEKSPHGGTNFSIRFILREQLKFSYFNSAGRATTNKPLTIKRSRNNVDYRVKCEIRSGLGQKKDIIGLNAHNGEACFAVYHSKFNILIVPRFNHNNTASKKFLSPQKLSFFIIFFPRFKVRKLFSSRKQTLIKKLVLSYRLFS